MCKHHKSNIIRPRHGSSIEHGKAHAEDHRRWSRRDFLTGLGTLGAGVFYVAGTPVRAYGSSRLLAELTAVDTNRILVIVQLSGGNDGLNTIIPYNNDIYYNQRPGIAIAKQTASALDLNGDLGMHPAMATLAPYYGDGNMSILQNVGYPDANLSHFRSTDIWMAASDASVVERTGWIGRYLDSEFPDFQQEPPEYPLAVQIGGAVSQMFQGPAANMGMSLISTDFFERLASGGELFDTSSLPQTTYGTEMGYLRSVANDSFLYAEAVRSASDAGANAVEYPANNPLANNLATVARLVKGNLGSKVYHVSQGGFDTHANQLPNHDRLLGWLASGIDVFLRDLAAESDCPEVLIMTFSEFGRRVGQNGSQGTDHGTAAPLFMFGPGVSGGLFGEAPDLDDLDGAGNLNFDIDFRSVYGSVLQDWFGLQPDVVRDALLGFEYDTIPFVADPARPVAVEPAEQPETFSLDQNYPNPFNPTTKIHFDIPEHGPVLLEVFDIQGRRVATLVDQTLPAGAHTASFDAGPLPSGVYLYRLVTKHGLQSRKMTLTK